MHKNRSYQVSEIADLAVVVEKLTQYDWCGCNGFRWASLTLLNDATGGDGAQEYAVFKGGKQVESLTVSWMKPEDLSETLTKLDKGDWPDVSVAGAMPKVETPAEHGTCYCCA